MVWSYDLRDGMWKLRHVIETYEHDHGDDLVEITVAGENIKATSKHPFWVVEGQGLESRPKPEHVPEVLANAAISGRWVDAGDLRKGDVLLLKLGQQAPVTALSVQQVCQKVYNLQIEELHCYAVGVSQVLVHNNSGDDAARARELQESINRLCEQARQAQEQHLNPELIEDINRTIAQLQREINKIFGIGQ